MSAALRTAYTVSRLAPLMWRWRVVHSDAPEESGFALTRSLAKHVARQRITLAQKRWKRSASKVEIDLAPQSEEAGRPGRSLGTAGPSLLPSAADRPASGDAAASRH